VSGSRYTRRGLLALGAGAMAGGVAWRALDEPPTRLRSSCGASAPQDPPGTPLRLPFADAGVVLRHGDGPDGCDALGARDVVVWRDGEDWFMHYDGAGPQGWLACLATSTDGRRWTKHGPVLGLGPPGAPDSASASFAFPVDDGKRWHLFYLGTQNTTPPPDRVPSPPYVTLKATAPGPTGPWTKQPDVVPFSPTPGTFYADVASPGSVLRRADGEWWMFFAASAGTPILRTIGRARTRDLDGPWTVDADPVLPPSEQIENSSFYFEDETDTWFMFVNHAHPDGYTDGIWAYWTQDLAVWDPRRRAIVVDGPSSCWSKQVIGNSSVIALEDRIAVYYDGRSGPGASHMGRDVAVGYLPRPLRVPA
jgi:hypothetical protein